MYCFLVALLRRTCLFQFIIARKVGTLSPRIAYLVCFEYLAIISVSFYIKRNRLFVLKRASAYKGSATQCNLCLAEKFCILTADKQPLLNRRSELISKCRHESKFYAENVKFQPLTQAVT